MNLSSHHSATALFRSSYRSKTDGRKEWACDQATGIQNLSVVPEPTAATVVLACRGLLVNWQR